MLAIFFNSIKIIFIYLQAGKPYVEKELVVLIFDGTACMHPRVKGKDGTTTFQSTPYSLP